MLINCNTAKILWAVIVIFFMFDHTFATEHVTESSGIITTSSIVTLHQSLSVFDWRHGMKARDESTIEASSSIPILTLDTLYYTFNFFDLIEDAQTYFFVLQTSKSLYKSTGQFLDRLGALKMDEKGYHCWQGCNPQYPYTWYLFNTIYRDLLSLSTSIFQGFAKEEDWRWCRSLINKICRTSHFWSNGNLAFPFQYARVLDYNLRQCISSLLPINSNTQVFNTKEENCGLENLDFTPLLLDILNKQTIPQSEICLYLHYMQCIQTDNRDEALLTGISQLPSPTLTHPFKDGILDELMALRRMTGLTGRATFQTSWIRIIELDPTPTLYTIEQALEESRQAHMLPDIVKLQDRYVRTLKRMRLEPSAATCEMIGNDYYAAGDYEKASEWFIRLMNTSNSIRLSSEILVACAQACFLKKDYDKAILFFEKYFSYLYCNDYLSKINDYISLAICYEKKGNLHRAAELFRKARDRALIDDMGFDDVTEEETVDIYFDVLENTKQLPEPADYKVAARTYINRDSSSNVERSMAIKYYNLYLKQLQKKNIQPEVNDCLDLAEMYLEDNNKIKAAETCDIYLAPLKENLSPEDCLVAAKIYMHCEDYEHADEYYETYLKAIYKGNFQINVEVYQDISEAYVHMGNFHKASKVVDIYKMRNSEFYYFEK